MSKSFFYACLIIGAGLAAGEGFSLLAHRSPPLIAFFMLVVATGLQLVGVIGPIFLIRPDPVDVPKFTSRMTCDVCDHGLTHSQVYYSNGCCPYCGACSGSTIVSHKTTPVPLEI